MPRAYVPAFVVALQLLAQPAHAQETRKMEFFLGARENELDVKVEYLDPYTVDARLADSLVLPVSFEVRNVSSRPMSFDYQDVRLNLGGNVSLTPVSPIEATQEIRRARRVPALLRFLGNQSTAFQPNALEVMLETQRLKDGSLRPGQTKKGFVFFIRPVSPDPSTSTGVMWLETVGRPPQMLETKDVAVTTTTETRSGFVAKLRQTWNKYFGTPPAFNKSYALVVGIGNYQHLTPLSSPPEDVKKVKAYLEAQGFEVVAPKEGQVTINGLRDPQSYFTSKIQADDRFLFYFSGHGMVGPEGKETRGYIPLLDEVEGGHDRSIPMDRLVSWMTELKTEHLLVILDSCFSGLAIPGIEQKDADVKKKDADVRLSDSSVDREALNRLARGPAKFLLMAGTAGQVSFGGAEWGGSMFTDTLVKGLRSYDPYHNKILTTRALYVWLRNEVYRETQKAKMDLTPMFKDLGPGGASEGDFVFVH